MENTFDADRHRLEVGGLSRAQLADTLSSRGVQLNAYAETLLDDVVSDRRVPETLDVVVRSIGKLGLTEGAALPRIFTVAREQGLRLCPPDTGPYLGLVLGEEFSSPDAVKSSGRAPTGAVTVASAPLSDDHEYPKGFYLRVVDGRPWLRGYRCDGAHQWAPTDRFAFRVPATLQSRTEC